MNFKLAGISALAIHFPDTIRTNDYYREYHQELIEQAEQKTLARTFSIAKSESKTNSHSIWQEEMKPFLADPFRGTIERRIIGKNESALSISYQAAQKVLHAAQLSPKEIDLMLVATTFTDQIGPGNAAFLASKLALKGAAWNVESTQSSALVALQSASALIRIGEYKNILVVIGNNYSTFTDSNDTLSLLFGDGAGAFIVNQLQLNQGVIGTKIINTALTCDTFYHELTIDNLGNPQIFIRANQNAREILGGLVVPILKQCCEGAAKAAGVSLNEIDFFIFNTPVAWFANVCIRALGIDPQQTIDCHNRYGNIGSVLPLANLYHSAELGKINENDLILIFTIGSVSNAAASVMRWGKVKLGIPPAPPICKD